MSDKSLKDKAIKIKGKDYVLVSDRVIYFNETFKNGSIETEYSLDNDTYHFKAVVTPDAEHPNRKFVGHSQAVIGDGMVNKTAAMENAETSAVGRALAMLGIGVLDSIASADEMNKATGSTGNKFATPKQIQWLRTEAKRATGLEHADDLDEWIEETIGARPQKLSIKSVAIAADKIRAIRENNLKAEIEASDTVVVTDDMMNQNINLDDLPY